jgi:hypothetical protein
MTQERRFMGARENISLMRCDYTGNLCGTDSWERGWECMCVNCQRWLGQQEGYISCQQEIASWLYTEFTLNKHARQIAEAIANGEHKKERKHGIKN